MRVGTQHFQFHAFGRPSARHISRFVPRAVADDGAAFRHAVGDGIGEIDGTHERFHLGVERCAADDDFLDVPPEKAQAFRACLFLDLFADDGDVQKQLAQFAVDFRKDFFLEYLFDDQWHTRHDAGMKLCHGGHDDLGRRHAREEIQVGTETYAIEEVVDQTEHVSHGQHGYDIVAGAMPMVRLQNNTLDTRLR